MIQLLVEERAILASRLCVGSTAYFSPYMTLINNLDHILDAFFCQIKLIQDAGSSPQQFGLQVVWSFNQGKLK